MVVHQLVPTFHEGDATGHAAVQNLVLLRRLGVYGEIYALEVAPALRSLVKPLHRLRLQGDELVLYHHGISSPGAGRLVHLPCRRGIVFHNISPYRVYRDTPLGEALLGGRAQLAALADHVEVSLGVSDFNSAELRAAGHRNVHTLPLFVERERFALSRADGRMRKRLAGEGIAVVSVSRILPHKRFEDLLSLHEELLRLDARARLVLVGGYDEGSAYFKSLARRARRMPGVTFLGKVTHAQLVAAYRSASAYVSMSEHEGFGVPLVEAMAAEVPVVAYGAAAVPETLGGAGICFDEKRYALLAELVREVAANPTLRAKILRGQARRLNELSPENAQRKLAAALGLDEARPRPRRARRPGHPKIGFVVQRYGDVSGGAEVLARMLAHRLSRQWDITVLTTCAKDHLTWKNELEPGPSRDGRVRVLRFPSSRTRDMAYVNAYSRLLFGHPLERVREEHFVAEQGPLVPGLFRHLAFERERYDGFVFFTYLYATSAWGLPLVADRALMVPTTHEEPPLDFHVYRDVFERPRGLVCLTPEELQLIDRRFPRHARAQVISAGVEPRKANPDRFSLRHELARPYLFYVGRVERGKGIPELLRFHRELVRRFEDAPELVLAGAASMQVSGDRVRYLGRIGEQEKLDALTGALAVVAPSRLESLSLLALEAFAQGTPVLANGDSEVLSGQIARSGAGRTYVDTDTFIQGVREIGQRRDALGRKALAFARKHSWDLVTAAYRREMASILEGRR